MTTTRMPARVVSPGKVISKELAARGWSQRDLADVMGRPYQAINEIIKGTKQITPDSARELSKAFGTSIDFWINLEANYRLFLAKQEDKEKQIERRSLLYSTVPIREMIKRGWIKGSDDIDELENEVCSFLGVTDLHETPAILARFRLSKNHSPETSAKIAWLKRVENLARQQQVNEYNRERLLNHVAEITVLAKDVEDVRRVPDSFRQLGVHFLIVPHLPQTYLDGAALFVDDHPVIAITLRYDRIDWFWFTILHELAHIILGHPMQIDSLFGEKEPEDLARPKPEYEEKANEIARNYLLDTKAFDQFVDSTRPYFSKSKIEAFAAGQQRHPGIVLGQLQYFGIVEYKYLRSMLDKVGPHLKVQMDVPVP